jgi:alkylated DNA repair dioxygenase AlkB
MNPKRHQLSIVIIVAAAAAVSFFASCAEMESNNTKSLLSAAGFHTLTPQTAQQKEIYVQLEPYRVARVTAKGKTAYVYKDEKAGLAYVGHEAEYQRYKNLCIQQRIAQDYYMATTMDPYWSNRWYGAWGYGRMWW